MFLTLKRQAIVDGDDVLAPAATEDEMIPLFNSRRFRRSEPPCWPIQRPCGKIANTNVWPPKGGYGKDIPGLQAGNPNVPSPWGATGWLTNDSEPSRFP